MAGVANCVSLVALLALCSAAQAQVPSALPELVRAVTATQAAKAAYAFDYELHSGAQDWRARFEPSAAPALRMVSPRREELSQDEVRAFDRLAEDFEGVQWCASERMVHIRDARLLREDAESATYGFQPTPESIRGEQARRFAARLRGEFTLTKVEPDVTRVRFYTPEAFSPFPLVRLERLDITVTCAPAPNGRRYAAETVSEVRGSAFGQAFDERSVQRARNLSSAP